MHIVTRPSMLTLTVDRLVGNGSSGGHNDRMSSLSPESSDTGSESGSVPSSKPSHFSKISLLLSKSTTELMRSPPGRSRDDSPGSNIQITTRRVKTEEDQSSVEGDRLESKGESSNDNGMNIETRAVKTGDSEHKDEISDLRTSGTLTQLSTDECDDFGMDPRPPSATSEVSSASTWSNSWGSTTTTMISESKIPSQPNPGQNNGPLTHNSPKLKFSIHDILRPDFGQRAITKIQHRRSRRDESHFDNQNNRDPNNGIHSPAKRSRPSSVKNHSEDSNSSSSSHRREEVVDEAKVNPEVPKGPLLWPAWVYCTRYSDRPSSGPRSRRVRKEPRSASPRSQDGNDEKRPRTAFTAEQLGKLKQEFDENRYLTEKRRQDLARDLKLHENQIKIWFQNKRAKLKKSSGQRGGLAIQLMAQGLYNHSTVPMDEDEDYLPC